MFITFLHSYLHNTVMIPEHFYHNAWFVNWSILTFALYNQLHMYGFSEVVDLLGS